MATVIIQKRERKDRNSYIIYYKDPATGQIKYYKTFQRQREARQAANNLRALIDAGGLSEAKRSKVKPRLLSFEEVGDLVIADWKNRLASYELREITFAEYKMRLHLVGKVFGKRLFCEIMADQILRYRNTVAKEFSNVTSNRSLFIIKQVFKHGRELGAVKDDLTMPIHYLSEKSHQRNRFLMPPDLDRLIEASHQVRANFYLPALIYLIAEHGASKQEALSLKWSDIDFDFEGLGLIRFFRTKNGRERCEYLMPRTKEALLSLREHQQWMRRRERIESGGSDYVFSRLSGSSITRFYKAWRAACDLAGLKDFHFHDLRHTFCSNLLLSGADLKDAKEMIGHNDLAMTDRYAHLVVSHKLSKQEELANFYANGNQPIRQSGKHIGNTEGVWHGFS